MQPPKTTKRYIKTTGDGVCNRQIKFRWPPKAPSYRYGMALPENNNNNNNQTTATSPRGPHSCACTPREPQRGRRGSYEGTQKTWLPRPPPKKPIQQTIKTKNSSRKNAGLSATHDVNQKIQNAAHICCTQADKQVPVHDKKKTWETKSLALYLRINPVGAPRTKARGPISHHRSSSTRSEGKGGKVHFIQPSQKLRGKSFKPSVLHSNKCRPLRPTGGKRASFI